MDLRQLCGDECGQRTTGNVVGSNLSEMLGLDLRPKNTHKTMKTAIIVIQKLDEPAQVQSSKNTTTGFTFNSLSSGEVMTTVLLKQMLLMPS